MDKIITEAISDNVRDHGSFADWVKASRKRSPSKEYACMEDLAEKLAKNAGNSIVAAAVRMNGLTLSLPKPARHCDILRRMPEKAARACVPSDQGFLTSAGDFVGRKTALEIARRANQLLKDTRLSELFSEDLW